MINRTFTLTHAAPSLHWEDTQTQCKEGAKYVNLKVNHLLKTKLPRLKYYVTEFTHNVISI